MSLIPKFGEHHAEHESEAHKAIRNCNACHRVYGRGRTIARKAGVWVSQKRVRAHGNEHYPKSNPLSLCCNHCGLTSVNLKGLALHKQVHNTFQQPRDMVSITPSSLGNVNL